LNIAQVSPLYERVPPRMYGGTERVVSYLTEELVQMGHDVTLFASGDSITKARLIAPCREALRLNANCIDQMAHHVIMLEWVLQRAAEFDIIHYHTDYFHFPFSKRQRTPSVTTLHGRLDIPDLVPLYREFRDLPLVSISNAQRQPLSWANWVGTVYHGLPRHLYTLHEEPGDYLAFLGRISPEKGVDRAIEIAKRAGIPLKISAKVDKADYEYYCEHIKRLLDHPLIEFIGEIGEGEKNDFLGNAYAFLFPINWPEPFGIAMIESMACGTPVVAFRRGSVPEVIEEGVTGFIVDSIEEAVRALNRIPALDRACCRRRFEQRFDACRMARDYINIYERLVDRRQAAA